MSMGGTLNNNQKTNNMYNKNMTKPSRTNIKRNTSYIGETIEQKIRRIVNNKEPITDGAPLIYSERKDGVKPEYNIRTDRWELAVDAMDYVAKSHTAHRQDRHKTPEQKEAEKKTAQLKAAQANEALAKEANLLKNWGTQDSTSDGNK